MPQENFACYPSKEDNMSIIPLEQLNHIAEIFELMSIKYAQLSDCLQSLDDIHVVHAIVSNKHSEYSG